MSVTDCPLHIEADETVTMGRGLTVTVTCAMAEQPFASVPVTVYVVVDDGLAVTLDPVVALRFVLGVQL